MIDSYDLDKPLWKELYENVSDKCQDNKCIFSFFTNTAKVRDDMLQVKIARTPALLKFPSEGLFSSSKVPDAFALLKNRDTWFRSILKPSGTDEIELDGEKYKIEVFEVIMTPTNR